MTSTMQERTMRGIGSRTGIGLLAIQSPCKKPSIRPEAAAQSKGPMMASIGLLQQQPQQKDEKDLDRSDSSGGSVSQSGTDGVAIAAKAAILSPSPIRSQHLQHPPPMISEGGPRGGNNINASVGFETSLMSSTGSLQQQQGGIVWAKGKKLGNGAFGSVFSALDLKTGLHFAVKQVLMGGTAGSTTRKKQGRALQREVYYLETLSHPNIVR